MKWFLRILIIGLLVYGLYVGIVYWAISMDDGPFSGTARTQCPNRNPDQTFDLFSGQQLLVFDPWIEDAAGGSEWNGLKVPGKKPNGDKAPTVGLRNSKGKIQWCIMATGMPDTEVATLRFKNYWTPIPFMHPYVVGRVLWTYGDERMTWSIREDGTLDWYRYSW